VIAGGLKGRRRWILIAGLSIVLCLAFLCYEAKMRPQPNTQKSVPIQRTQ
jgi:hypothetical protein